MATHYTNGDRILQAVLADPKLAELGELYQLETRLLWMLSIQKIPQYELLR